MPTDPRPIDHVVIAGPRPRRGAGRRIARLGFTLTPVARHPFGTANSLVQLHGSYIELLAVADPALIPEPVEGRYSFAAFNRDFLKRREGPSMLALQSADAAADLADFEANDLPTLRAGSSFQRLARTPEGRRPRGRLLGDLHLRRADPRRGLLHLPAPQPRPLLVAGISASARTARRSIDAVVMAARDPADYHIFFTHFTGQHDMRSDSLMVSFDTGGGKVEIVHAGSGEGDVGVEVGPSPKPHFIALRIATTDLAAAAVRLKGNGIPFVERMGPAGGAAVGGLRRRRSPSSRRSRDAAPAFWRCRPGLGRPPAESNARSVAKGRGTGRRAMIEGGCLCRSVRYTG